jgi:hypothetical protein
LLLQPHLREEEILTVEGTMVATTLAGVEAETDQILRQRQSQNRNPNLDQSLVLILD